MIISIDFSKDTLVNKYLEDFVLQSVKSLAKNIELKLSEFRNKHPNNKAIGLEVCGVELYEGTMELQFNIVYKTNDLECKKDFVRSEFEFNMLFDAINE